MVPELISLWTLGLAKSHEKEELRFQVVVPPCHSANRCSFEHNKVVHKKSSYWGKLWTT